MSGWTILDIESLQKQQLQIKNATSLRRRLLNDLTSAPAACLDPLAVVVLLVCPIDCLARNVKDRLL